MVRSESEIDELIKLFEQQLDITEKDPSKLVRATGGSVPPVISMVQVLFTKDMDTLVINLLKWVKGEENGVLALSRAMLNKLRDI